ncbi:hypothetical protein HY504_03595 [Candidatus Wolfebacteria bacterium]|nr:hypothetical protein [Candidatus Wolfebacteria bacterium]
MKASSKRIISIFASILLLVGLLFFYSTFIRPEYDDVIAVRARIASQKALIADYETDLVRIEQLTTDYQNLAQVQTSLTAIVPPAESTATAVAQLGGLAEAHSITIRALSAQVMAFRPSRQPGLVKNLGSVRLTLRAQATYENFKNFIRGIETNMNLMDVQSVKIETLPALRAIPTGFLDYTVVLVTHYEGE